MHKELMSPTDFLCPFLNITLKKFHIQCDYLRFFLFTKKYTFEYNQTADYAINIRNGPLKIKVTYGPPNFQTRFFIITEMRKFFFQANYSCFMFILDLSIF